MASDAPNTLSGPKRQLTLFDSTCIILGVIIGSSIYEMSPLIAICSGDPWTLAGMWFVGGLIALAGGLCYAELGSAYPQSGGEYVYLSKAYGCPLGVSFAWIEYWIIRPGNIGAMAYVFARYADQLLPLPFCRIGKVDYTFTVYAATTIIALTTINLLGVRTGKWTQNLLTAVKVFGLLAIVFAGLLALRQGVSHVPAPAEPMSPNLSLALIFVMFAYGGWNEMYYVASEVRDPHRNFLRAMVLGITAITVIYLLVNAAFIWTLGFHGLAQSDAVATDVVTRVASSAGGKAISLLICLSALGAINAMIFTGARINHAVGADHRIFAWLGRWNTKYDAPARSLLIQAGAGLLLVVIFGPNKDAFERLVIFTAPFFYTFVLLTGFSLLLLRFTLPKLDRPYRVHFFPLPPLIFVAGCGFMLYQSLNYMIYDPAGHQSIIGIGWIGFVVVGMVVLLIASAFLAPPKKPTT
jgi:APA family basic amino acid/polyamine antiporter